MRATTTNRSALRTTSPDPAIRDPETVTLREVVKALRDDETWTPALIPVGEGLLCAARSV